jgi:hypothetical protein
MLFDLTLQSEHNQLMMRFPCPQMGSFLPLTACPWGCATNEHPREKKPSFWVKKKGMGNDEQMINKKKLVFFFKFE